MTKLEKAATSHNCNFMGDWCCFFLTLQEQFAENANKSYVCKVIVVLHINHNFFGIR